MIQKILITILALAIIQPAEAMKTRKRFRPEYEERPVKIIKETLKDRLIWHVQNGDIKKMTKLLASGTHPETTCLQGIPALAHAAYLGDEEACELLITYGANVNATDPHGNTPLIWAGKGDHEHIFELLISYGAQVKKRNKTDNDAFAYFNGTASDFVYEGDQSFCALQ